MDVTLGRYDWSYTWQLIKLKESIIIMYMYNYGKERGATVGNFKILKILYLAIVARILFSKSL